jgi:hypothetical protein
MSQEEINKCREDPVYFVANVLGIELLPFQKK